MRYYRSILLVMIMAFALSGTFGSKLVQAADHQTLVLRVIDSHLLPRLEVLNSASQRNAEAWEKACSVGTLTQTETLKKTFQTLSDAWLGIDHINFGPVTLLFRRDRFYHWPERKNAVGRALARLATTPAPYDDATAFQRSSVAIQGLPAIERMLFSSKSPVAAETQCPLGLAASKNMVRIADNLIKEWLELKSSVSRGKGSPIYFETMTEAATLVLTDLSTGFLKLRDIRIQQMLGTSPDGARPKRGEQWRSDRTVRNIQLNLEALRDLATVFGKTLPEDKRLKHHKALNDLISSATALPTEIDPGLYEPAIWQAFSNLRDQAQTAAQLVVSSLSEHYDVRIGFNAMDGDG